MGFITGMANSGYIIPLKLSKEREILYFYLRNKLIFDVPISLQNKSFENGSWVPVHRSGNIIGQKSVQTQLRAQ